MTRVDYYNDPNAPKANSIAVAVSAFIQDDEGRILMIRRTDNDLYSIPGGQLELGETLAEAAVREVREETGVECEVTEVIGLYSDPKHVIAYDDGEIRQEFSICFRAAYISGHGRLSAESKEVIWVHQDQLSTLNIHKSIKLRLEHALTRVRGETYFS
ncbi:NUDIX hydrolase [Amycolatopsis sp. cmx-4-83]|uniref:NUDIX hydrolase n=1 Tax=Amycolatopsis sp. cmx-4-83 TaxID=2790940 RepID=UPI00397C116C